MKKLLAGVIAGGLLLSLPVFAQRTSTTSEEKKETKTTSNAGTTKSKTHTVVGTVKEFDTGKSIKIATSSKKSQKFSLDDKDVATTVDPAVGVGVKVKAVQKTDANGIKSLKIEPYASKSKKS